MNYPKVLEQIETKVRDLKGGGAARVVFYITLRYLKKVTLYVSKEEVTIYRTEGGVCWKLTLLLTKRQTLKKIVRDECAHLVVKED